MPMDQKIQSPLQFYKHRCCWIGRLASWHRWERRTTPRPRGSSRALFLCRSQSRRGQKQNLEFKQIEEQSIHSVRDEKIYTLVLLHCQLLVNILLPTDGSKGITHFCLFRIALTMAIGYLECPSLVRILVARHYSRYQVDPNNLPL